MYEKYVRERVVFIMSAKSSWKYIFSESHGHTCGGGLLSICIHTILT